MGLRYHLLPVKFTSLELLSSQLEEFGIRLISIDGANSDPASTTDNAIGVFFHFTSGPNISGEIRWNDNDNEAILSSYGGDLLFKRNIKLLDKALCIMGAERFFPK
jgi:hypothetical protein